MKIVFTGSRFYPRRYQNGGNPDTETVKVEIVWLGTGNVVGTGNAGDRSWNVIVETAVLVVYNEEQDLIPLRACSESFVDLFYEFLSF